MSFIARRSKFRNWPVTVKQSECNDAGEVTETASTFVAHWRPFTEEDIENLLEAAKSKYPAPKVDILPTPTEGKAEEVSLKEGEGPVPMSVALKRNAHLFCNIVGGWGEEVTGEDKSPLQFSEKELAAMITGPDGMAISTGLHRSLLELRYGLAREKNLPASPAPGVNSAPAEAETSSPATLLPSE
ncbi:MAG: hypothetical protein PHQ05_10060 [Sterolibacterium sp.]|nr:hypothetical protein [Sterolibacterium sp.]